jgi:hypothetical protein
LKQKMIIFSIIQSYLWKYFFDICFN